MKVSLQYCKDDKEDEKTIFMWGKLSADFKKITGSWGYKPNEIEDPFKLTLDESAPAIAVQYKEEDKIPEISLKEYLTKI